MSSQFTANLAWRYRVLPIEEDSVACTLACDKEFDKKLALTELEFILGKKVHVVEKQAEEITKLLNQAYPQKKDQAAVRKTQINLLSPGVLEELLEEARSLGSSDLHIENTADHALIRFRIDGKLIQRYKFTKQESLGLINKIKIAANCDIAEKRLPQDGRISIKVQLEKYDVRVSIVPAMFGEKVVMRILGSKFTGNSIAKLPLSEIQKKEFVDAIKKPHGILLVSGPTGSGKTTTLYTTLSQLNNSGVNILTIEDPIEYTIEGINQVQIKEDIGLSFSTALRSFLRQDPDIIMVGEIRDAETAEIAVRAAMTGHLVLSTIHTNSSWQTIDRLIDMGIPKYLLSNVLNISIAQRLVRLLCKNCKVAKETVQGTKKQVVFESAGCAECNFTGYSGRTAIFEILAVNSDVKKLIRETQPDFEAYYKTHNIQTLKDSAELLYYSGLTSYDEIEQYLTH